MGEVETHFNPDALEQPILGIAYNGPSNKSDQHDHRSGQLLHSIHGVIEVQVENQLFIVPPNNAVWIPPSIMHCAVSRKPIHFRSLFIHPQYCSLIRDRTHILSVNELLKALIKRLCELENYESKDQSSKSIVEVTLNEIANATQRPFTVTVSSHETIYRIYEFMQESNHWSLTNEDIASKFAMSLKTMNRLFQKETGMTFHQWITQVKLMLAMAWLSEGDSITMIAHRLCYSSDSAFIAQFKRHLGMTPGEFYKENSQ